MKHLLIIIFTISSFVIKAQESYHFNQLDSLQGIKSKRVLVIVTTKWCNYCKALEEVIANDIKLKHLINDQYYLIKLDAEEKKAIKYKDVRFEFNAKLGYHQLAISLADNQKLIFPTIYVLNNSNEIYYSYNGFLSNKGLFSVLSHN
jgi:thioredoxin-related protein